MPSTRLLSPLDHWLNWQESCQDFQYFLEEHQLDYRRCILALFLSPMVFCSLLIRAHTDVFALSLPKLLACT